MAVTPNYEGAKRAGSIILDNAAGTALSAAVLTGVAAGTKVKEIRIHSGPTTAPGGSYKLVVVIDDGTNQTVIDIVTIINLADSSQQVLRYDNVYLPGVTHSLKFQMRTGLASGATIHIEAFGCDF